MDINQTSHNATQTQGEPVHFTSFTDENLNGWEVDESSPLQADHFCCLKRKPQSSTQIYLDIKTISGFTIGEYYLLNMRIRRVGGSLMDRIAFANNTTSMVTFSGLGSSWETRQATFRLRSKDYFSINGDFSGDNGEIHIDDICISVLS